MHIIAHTSLNGGPYQDYPALLFDWDRFGEPMETRGHITALISLPGGYGPQLRFVELDHVSQRSSAHYWRRPDESPA